MDSSLYFEDKGISNIDDDSKISLETINHLNLNNNGKNFVFLHFMSTHSPFIKPNISEEKNLNPIRHGDPKKEYNDSIIGYGATAKATTILNYCKIGANFIDYFVDTTPDKQNKYMPGSKIKILKYHNKLIDKTDYIFLGAWNFKKEIFNKEKKFLNRGGKFITHIPIPKII